jgi:3-oxoacyl-[acyl-carrier-protein] synthase II
MRFTVRGIGWVTPFGIGSGQPSEVFRMGSGRLPAFKSGQFLETPHPRFGRFDSYAKAGFAAIALALGSAGLDHWTQKRNVGLVVGTRLGCLGADLAYFQTAACDGGTLASPNLFAYTLPSTMLGEASIQFGLTGPSFVVDDSAGHLAGVHAALDLLSWGLCETVVAGWCDVSSKVSNLAGPDLRGAVFFVLTNGSEAAPWRWDGRELTNGAQPVADLAALAQGVLERQGSAER